MLAPFTQQVLGIQQDVHAFGEEDADQLRIAALAALRHTLVFGVGQTLLMQRLHARQKRLGTGNRRQRLAFQIIQASAEQAFSAAEQLGGCQVDLNQVGLELLDQLLQRRGDFRHWQDTGHIGTALEGVQGTLQIIGHRLRQLLRAVGEKAHQGVQMGLRLVAENFQQLRVEGLALERLNIGGRAFERCVVARSGLLDKLGSFINALGLGYLGGRGVRFWGRQPLCQRMCGGSQQVDVIALTLRLGSEFVDQRRHQRHHVEHHLLHRRARLDAAIQHAVEQVLDGPGQLADDQRTHHATATLEGMEGAANFDQRILVVQVGLPLRQVLGNGFQHLAGFFDEDFQQLFVHRLFIGRRRQQARRHIGGRRVDGLHRGGHHIGHRQRFLYCRRLDLGRDFGGAGQFDFRQFQIRQLKFVPLRRLGLHVQAQFFELQRRFLLRIEQGCGNDLFAL